MKKITGFIILTIYYSAAIYTAFFHGQLDGIVLGLTATIGSYLFLSEKNNLA